jgi:hypothetical protein
MVSLLKLVSKSSAKDRGLKNYFTGVKCKHGHLAERSTKGGKCAECNKASSKAQYKADPKKCYEASMRNGKKNNGSYGRKYRAKKKAEAQQLIEDSLMNITTKVDICVGLMTASQIDNLVDCGVANYADFTQRKQYNEFRFTGDKDCTFVTSWVNLKAIKHFTVEIGREGILIGAYR